MKRALSAASAALAELPDRVRRHKWWVASAFVIATAVIVSGLPKLTFDFTIERWLKQDDAAFVAYDDFREQFGSDDGVVIVYAPKDGDVFSQASLEVVKGIRDDLVNYHTKLAPGETSALERIVDVDTLINAPVLTVTDGTMLSRWLVGDTVPSDPAQLEEIRRTARAERGLPLKYFSADERYGAIYIKTDFGAVPIEADGALAAPASIDAAIDFEGTEVEAGDLRFKPTEMADYVALHAALNDVLDDPRFTSRVEYYKVGNTIDSENQIKMGEEMGLLYLIGLLIMLSTLLAIFRSFAGVVWPLAIVVTSTLWTLGLAGWLGLSASPFVILTILLILTIGMADVVHMLSSFLYFRDHGHDASAALREAYSKAGLGCCLTTVTAALGILSLVYTDLVPVINFSLMSALGICVALVLTLALLPILLDLWSPVPEDDRPRRGFGRLVERLTPNFVAFLQRRLDTVVPTVEKRPYAYIVAFFTLFALCVAGALQVKVDYSIYDQYAFDSNFFQSIRLLDERMAGSSRMSLYVDLGEDNGFQDPAVLETVDGLQRKLERDYARYVVTTDSIVDVVKDAYRKQNDGLAEFYRIPADRAALSQTLFTFNVADPEERSRMVSENYQKAAVTVTLRSYGSNEYTAIFDRMKSDIDAAVGAIKQTYPQAAVSITGLFPMGMKAADYLVVNELQSFGLSILTISLILLVLFSSLKAGLVSLVPNVIPSFLVLGLLGWLGAPLDFYTMMLAPVAVGIAVDDTIHFMTLYRAEVLKDGDIRRALVETVKECGQAVVFNSMILGLGFGIMAVATTPGLANLGKYGFLAIFSGLVCELFLLPALILALKLRFRRTGNVVEAAAKPLQVS